MYQTRYKTREEAKKSIFEYVEIFYNNKRIHSATECFSPSEYERMYGKKKLNEHINRIVRPENLPLKIIRTTS
ncbi:MAG: hypothetical protein C6W54_17825 [Bacillaceae bacterium]|nr:MAG: hypothetical protein C6W54_17825 [Bacillaceae bacterium]